jgi:hypothetical protein
MQADPDQVHDCPIMGRGLAAGAFWGAPLGLLVLIVIFQVGPAQWPQAVLPGCAAGAVVGGLVGVISGLVLAIGEHTVRRGNRERRRTAFISSVVPFLLLALTTIVAPQTLVIWLPLALVSGIAGALLAPCVVLGRLHE